MPRVSNGYSSIKGLASLVSSTYRPNIYIDPTSTKYNHFVDATIWRDKVVVATGKELLIFDSSDVEEALRRKQFLTPYKAYLDRVKGALYVLKRLPWMLRL
uniref:Uncharacterized protein n=1 Tax=Ignisphaera aggregans TaxID=334771 RepID=A0A7J2U322_9CREN